MKSLKICISVKLCSFNVKLFNCVSSRYSWSTCLFFSNKFIWDLIKNLNSFYLYIRRSDCKNVVNKEFLQKNLCGM